MGAVQGYIRYLRDRSLEVGVISIDVARQRKTAAEAEMAEIELAKARADVIGIDDVAKQWEAILSAVRTRMLAVPTKIAPIVAVETDQSIVKELIEDGVYTALGELAGGLSDDTGSDEEPSGGVTEKPKQDGTPAKANHKRVGRPKTKTKPGGKRRARKLVDEAS